MTNRVTSNATEVLSTGAAPKARVTSNTVEVLNNGGTTKARVNPKPIEVLSSLAIGPPGTAKPFAAHKLALVEEEPWRAPATRLFAPQVIISVLPATRWRMPEFDDPDNAYRVRPRRVFTPIIQTDDGYTFVVF